MLLDFFKLREQPFGVTPDPRYLYFSPGHREALASLFYGIETGRGFLSLIAQPGMGKTTLLFQLLQRWKGYVHSAFLFQTQCDSKELIRYLLNDLGLSCDGSDFVRMHSELNQFLLREAISGRRVVVFIDEAQNLTDSVLETVRLLSNFEATDKKLLQIVLAGQPELEQRLMHPGLAQLRQRIAIQARLDPLPSTEVIPYVNHRLEVAGYKGLDLFSPGAFALIAERSNGIPRLINNICFNALTISYAKGKEQITSEIVSEAAQDLSLKANGPIRQFSKLPAAGDRSRRLRQSLHSWYSNVRQSFFKSRLFQSSVLAIVLGSLAINFGLYSGTRGAQASQEVRQIIGNAATTSTHQPLAATRATGQNDGSPAPSAAPVASGVENRSNYFTYVVQADDTLHDLCVSSVGRYDSAVLSEVKKLNPDLKRFDRLEAGQEIRLPVELPK
jgi:type II secretory pathway predicted ATPase ExeA